MHEYNALVELVVTHAHLLGHWCLMLYGRLLMTVSMGFMARFHTAIAIVIATEASLSPSLGLFPLSDSDSDASFTTIGPSL